MAELKWGQLKERWQQPYRRYQPRFKALLGDFIRAYVEHLTVRKWRRSNDWEFVEKEMRQALNQVSL